MVKGIYILIARLEQDRDIKIGALGRTHFKAGFYLYVGSAKNGLEQRISRHLREKKKKHWHIDHLLEYAKVVDVKIKTGGSENECLLAKKVSEFTSAMENFGSSDCRCKGHLFYHPEDLSSLSQELDRLDVEDIFWKTQKLL